MNKHGGIKQKYNKYESIFYFQRRKIVWKYVKEHYRIVEKEFDIVFKD